MPHSYESDLRSGNSRNGGGNREAQKIDYSGRKWYEEILLCRASRAGRISMVSPIKVRSKKKNDLQARWGVEIPHLQLWRAMELRAPGLNWKLERLHTCLASGKLQHFSSSWTSSVSMLWLAQHEGTAPRETLWAAEHAIPSTSRGSKQEENLCPSLISL